MERVYNRRLLKSALSLLCIYVPLAWAQVPLPSPSSQPLVLSLKEATSKAIDYAPVLQVAQRERDVVSAKLFQAKSASILPEISGRILTGLVPDIPPDVGPAQGFPTTALFATDWGPYIRARIEAVQPLFLFGKLSGLRKAAKSGVDLRTEGIRATHNEVTLQVKQVYYTIQYLHSVDEFLDDLLSKAKDTRAKVEEKIRSGSPEVTDIDLIRVSVFQGETQRRSIELKNGLQLAYVTLKILTGIPNETPVELDHKTVAFSPITLQSIENVMALAQEKRPELKQIEDLVRVQEGLLTSVESAFYPQFFLGGFFEYNHAPGRPPVRNPYLNNDFVGAMGGAALGFQQNLSFHNTYGKVREARAELKKAQAQRDYARQGIELEIRKAYIDTVAKLGAMEASERAVKSGRSWVLASILNFQAGLAPVKDLLEAFIGYSSVRAAYLQTLNEYNFAVSKLEQAIGGVDLRDPNQ